MSYSCHNSNKNEGHLLHFRDKVCRKIPVFETLGNMNHGPQDVSVSNGSSVVTTDLD